MKKGRISFKYQVAGKGNHLKTRSLPYRPPGHVTVTSTSSSVPLPVPVQHLNGNLYDALPLQVSNEFGSSSINYSIHCQKSSTSATGRYRKAKYNQNESWTALRTSLSTAFHESLAPSEQCDNCGISSADIYHCSDCSPRTFLCLECIRKAHLFQYFHMMYIWRNNAWVPFSPGDVILESFVHQHCSHTYFRDIIVVGAKGRHHKAKCQFCPCEEEATTLIRHHFWPSSPKKPKMCFDFHIMEMLRVLYLQVPVPVMDFCEALKLIYHPFVVTDNPILQDVYKVLINESFEEYRYFVHQMNTLSGISPDFSERLFECPACPQKDEYPRILSMDANFGLVRKKTSGESVAKPKHQGLYFLDQDEVDKFVRSSYISEPNKDVDCNEFKAGSNIRSKGRYHKLDETAVFGASCRHDFPQMMFSLKHGERLSYPVYLLQQLMEKYGTSDISFMYDISCMFESYIKKHHSDISLDAVKLAIPIFHAYGHKWDCQVRYSPRRLPGFGLTDGESLERLWSYLRSFSKITKEMTPSHRVDTLTDALIHYANRKQLKIGAFLRAKIDRAKDQLAAASEELSSLLRVMQVSVSDVRDHSLMEANRLSTNQALSGKEKTLHLLHKHCSERKILLETKKKYADGQAVAIKLQRSIARTNAQIRKYLEDLTKKFDSTLTFEKAVSCEFLIGPDARGYRHAEETLCLKERAEEEISLVSKEILNVAKIFCERHNHLTEALAREASESHCKLSQGKMSLISSKIVSVEREFSLLQKSCGSIVPIIPDFQSYSQTLKTTSLRLGDVFSVVELDEMVDDANAYEAEVEVEIEENSELEKWIEQIDTSIVEPEGEDD